MINHQTVSKIAASAGQQLRPLQLDRMYPTGGRTIPMTCKVVGKKTWLYMVSFRPLSWFSLVILMLYMVCNSLNEPFTKWGPILQVVISVIIVRYCQYTPKVSQLAPEKEPS